MQTPNDCNYIAETTGTSQVANISDFIGRLCFVEIYVDNNGYLKISGIFKIGSNAIENFSSCQTGQATPINATLEMVSGGYKLHKEFWGSAEYNDNTKVKYFVL